jgi:cytidylate kinase
MPGAGKTTLARGLAERLRLRYRARTGRHPGHLDHLRVAELEERFASGANGPLDLTGELIELDTSTLTTDELVTTVARRLASL